MDPGVILFRMYVELERLLEDEQTFEHRLQIIKKGNNIEKQKEYINILSAIRKDIDELTSHIRFSEKYVAERHLLGIIS